ncbi:hypothetical protein [Mycobacterium sp. shizuoka-1]|uniref:hypothetical protein n=1 Tax=Mycobacterium sp. shizuoka-1 TaxID=2039281 RepID=UPI000C0650C9|nr:hypothetical protein [Mycobacterium sp. shizuoka-1]GAY13879.1 hypothetical protein MSZK_06050 [Mycobacterium sp. shizuoka-1]
MSQISALVAAGAFAAGAITACAIATAAPASAGCNSVSVSFFGGGKRCDGPVDPVGNFTRCDSGYGMGFGGSRCYVVNLGDSGQAPHIP